MQNIRGSTGHVRLPPVRPPEDPRHPRTRPPLPLNSPSSAKTVTMMIDSANVMSCFFGVLPVRAFMCCRGAVSLCPCAACAPEDFVVTHHAETYFTGFKTLRLSSGVRNSRGESDIDGLQCGRSRPQRSSVGHRPLQTQICVWLAPSPGTHTSDT